MGSPDDLSDRDRVLYIIQECGGIDPLFEEFYRLSILYAAERSHLAFLNFDDSVLKCKSNDEIFANIQEALTHAGALSRFFWPMKKGNALANARGLRLREIFTVDKNSPIKWRSLRNAFEHYDEDIDRFLLADVAGCIFPVPIVGDATLADEAGGHIFKLIDPNREICVLLGKKFEFGPIRSEVQRIYSLAKQV